MRRDPRKAFARTGLNQSAHDQRVRQSAGFLSPYACVETLGVTRRTQGAIVNTSALHYLEHLLEMPELLPGQSGHFV